jgi:hypothetical protein
MAAPSSVYFTGSDYSYAFWFSYISVTDPIYIALLNFATSQDTDQVYIVLDSPSFQVATNIFVGTTSGTGFTSSSPVPNYTNWNHYAVTFQANGYIISLYLNGQLLGSLNNGLAPNNVTRQWCYIGRSTWSYTGDNTAITGYYDDIRIYSATLSQAQILYLVNNNFY